MVTPKKVRPLYLEQRVALARRALNECTVEFQCLLPTKSQAKFFSLMLDVIDVLGGDPSGFSRRRIRGRR